MPGVTYRVIPKQTFHAAAGTTAWIAKAISIESFPYASLIVRAHLGTAVTGGSLTVEVWPDAPTSEDATDFTPPGSALASITIDTNTVVNGFLIDAVDNATQPAFLRVKLVWSGGSAGSAVISADIVAKS